MSQNLRLGPALMHAAYWTAIRAAEWPGLLVVPPVRSDDDE